MRSHRSAHRAIRCMLLASTIGLSGCASFSPDGGMTVVSDVASQAIRKDVVFVRSADDAEAADRGVKRLLARALTVDAAVQIALLNNKGLQAAYNELALAETELVGQSLPPNPTFSISRISGDGASEIERQVVGDILALATLPFRTEIARDRFRQAQFSAALSDAAARRRRPARLLPRGRRQRDCRCCSAEAKSTAEATAQLAAEARRDRRRSTSSIRPASRSSTPRPPRSSRPRGRPRRVRASGSIRLMGLWGDDLGFQLPDKLPPLPRRPLGASRASRSTRSATASTCRSRASSSTRWRSRSISPQATRFVTLLDVAGIDRQHPRSGSAAVPRARLRRPVPDPDLRRRRGARAAGRRDLPAGVQPADRKGRQRPLGSARRLSRLSLDLRHRQPLSARGAAAAQDHLRGDAAALHAACRSTCSRC